MSNQQKVEYEPPSAEQIERFVRDFYREYSDERPDRAKVLAVTGFLKSVARALAKDLGIPVYPILVGKECDDARGCLVPFPAGTDLFGTRVYRDVRIPTDPKLLDTIAQRTGGNFYRATDRASLEGHLQDVLETFETSLLVEERQLTGYEDRFALFLFPGFLALALEFVLSATWLRRFP